MKKILIISAAIGALFAGSASAADMAVKAPIMKAPPPPVYNWTGCYLGGGLGYGMFNQDSFLETDPGHVPLSGSLRTGGRGWFGTVTGGCDYQFSTPGFIFSSLVIGAFADGDWGSLKGNAFTWTSTESEKSAWSAGGRIGWLVNPSLLSYFNGGYTEARFDGFEVFSAGLVDLGTNLSSHTYKGWFFGGGVEYALPFWSGLFWRNEARYAQYRADDISLFTTTTGLPAGTALNTQKTVETYRTELIWRFNWGGPVTARY
jgi:outer membrane immunogenic protein